LTGTLHVIASLVITTSNILAPIKSGMKTFWYWLTQVDLEKWSLKTERVYNSTVHCGIPPKSAIRTIHSYYILLLLVFRCDA